MLSRKILKLSLAASVVFFLAGFEGNGCCLGDPRSDGGGGASGGNAATPPTPTQDPCAGLDEAACNAKPSCEAIYISVNINCPACDCRPDPQGNTPPVCPACTCPTSQIFSDCQARPASCLSAADCQPGETCLFGGCPACDPSKGPCPMCPVASSGSCQPAPVPPPPPPPPPPTGCLQDADCGPGQRCQVDPTVVGCVAAQGHCVPVVPACQSDADCPAGQRCEIYATCMAVGCPPPPPNQCVPVSVNNCGSASCAAGEVCVHVVGGVVPPGTPNSTADFCKPFPSACGLDNACVVQSICAIAPAVPVSTCDLTVTPPTCTCVWL